MGVSWNAGLQTGMGAAHADLKDSVPKWACLGTPVFRPAWVLLMPT